MSARAHARARVRVCGRAMCRDAWSRTGRVLQVGSEHEVYMDGLRIGEGFSRTRVSGSRDMKTFVCAISVLSCPVCLYVCLSVLSEWPWNIFGGQEATVTWHPTNRTSSE